MATLPNLEILIVDDDAVIRLLHKRHLEQLNLPHRTLSFRDGREAYEHLQAKSPNEACFLVLLDLNMPVMDGWEFLEKCREHLEEHRIFVVIVTSSINRAEHLKGEEYDRVIRFFEKPFGSKALESIKKHKELGKFFQSKDD